MKMDGADNINHDITKLVLNDITTLHEEELLNAIENTLMTLTEGQDAIARLLAGCFSDGDVPTDYHLANVGYLQSFIASLSITLTKVKNEALYRKIKALQPEPQQT